jgi:YHS domain-containing protein
VIRFLLLSILIMLLARAVLRVMDGVLESLGTRPRNARPPARSMKLVRDPVCGTFVSPLTAIPVRTDKTTYYFCSDRCREVFAHGDPEHQRPHAS